MSRRPQGRADETDGKHVKKLVVPFEGGGLAVACPVGLENDLSDVAMVGPRGGDSAADRIGFGQRARIGFVGEGTVPVELQFLEHDGGCGSGLGHGRLR